MNTEIIKSLLRNLFLPCLLGLCFLIIPFMVKADQTTQTECLFNWAEKNYSSLFAPSGSSTAVWSTYSYRYYSASNAYLGVSSVDNHVYYQGTDGALQDEGSLSDWLPKAGCQNPPPPECLFNWAERNYSSLFAPSGTATLFLSPFTYRHYSISNAYLGVSSIDNHVYYMGSDSQLQDEGLLSNWLPKACSPPIANAGADQTAFVGTTVTLDGSSSSDPEGYAITYQWTLSQKPVDSQTSLLNPTSLHPTLAIDKPGSYKVTLVVNDGFFASSPATVIINTQNSKPVANAGTAQTGKVGDTLILNASASSDVDGDVLSYHWTLPIKPQNSNATLNNPNTISPSLTLDKPGNYTAQLIVNDGKIDSTPATVVLSTINSKPVAKASAAQSILLTTPATPVLLDGTGSFDADNDPLTYRWALINQPVASQSILVNPLASTSQFTPDQLGYYVAQLIVNDGKVDSDPNTTQITVTAPPPPQNNPPHITSTTLTAATVNQLYSYAVTATDADNDVLSYSLTVSPTGMSINASSGLIAWTPAVNQAGSQSVTVQVSDGKGGIDTQSLTLSVGSGIVQTTVPSLVGINRTSAEAALQQSQLTIGTVGFQYDAKIADGIVLNQSLATGSKAAMGTAVDFTVSLGANTGLPPNPATVAPEINPTVATTVADASQFLYSGSNPVQTGVAAGTIEIRRAAVIRGKLLDRQNNPLPGVTVTVKDHPEFGQTQSRIDGAYDLAVNGGGFLSLDYKNTGYLPVQRQVNVPWQDYVVVDDVVMIPLDTKVTTVDLTAAVPMQIAQGSPVTDQDGTRQATLMIPQGTKAQVYNPDGSLRDTTTLNLHLTEYTVGDNGPKAMPGPLPPTSAYTYAVEMKSDEGALKFAGKDVMFNQPVPFYVDNFLNMPVGIQVPVAYWNKEKTAWIPSDDGKVIKVLSVTSGLADIDGDGDGIADNATQLTALGFTDAERGQLATTYQAGKTLWRAMVAHLSTYDHNYGVVPAAGAIPPQLPTAKTADGKKLDTQNHACGSDIECQSQILGESIPIVGTPFSLHYASDRVAGRKTDNTLIIPLSGATVPGVLKRIDLEIKIAGRTITQSFPATANQSYTFTWDGKDNLGRELQGKQAVSIRVGYVYDGYYALPPAMARSFGAVSGQAIRGNIPARQEAIQWQNQTATMGSWDASSSSLGAWSLDVHHAYDVVGKVLYEGNGGRRSVDGMVSDNIIETVAGGGAFGDGGLATNAHFYYTEGLAIASDGSLYIADRNHIIRKVGTDGIITTVAGIGGTGINGGFSGDGGLATSASLSYPAGLAIASDGSLYIADSGNCRIRKVSADGMITTVAGNGSYGFSGDGGLAINASLWSPRGIAVAADGSLYIADTNNHRIRKVGADGMITTVAGSGGTGINVGSFSGDGGLATNARLWYPSDIAIASDGSVLIADTYNNRIRRVGTDGIITTVAVSLHYPAGVALATDGSVFIADSYHNIINKVGVDGIMSTVAGGGYSFWESYGFAGDGGMATSAYLAYPMRIAIANDGSLYIADTYNNRIRHVYPILPGLGLGDFLIPSQNNTEDYHFNSAGQHLRTLDTKTQAVIYSFDYDKAGHLSKITDVAGLVTSIERDALGKPVAIVAPFGQRTVLSLNADGYLSEVKNPANESYTLSYTADGLLTDFNNPRGNSSTMTYDVLGRLIKDQNADGGSQNLSRAELPLGYEVTRSTGENRSVKHRIETLTTGDQQLTDTDTDGTQTVRLAQTNGTTQTTQPDGTITTSVESPDPRFGMQAPIVSSLTTVTGGLTATTTHQRTATLSDKTNPLSLQTLTDTVAINGRTATSVYDAASKTTTATSAAGRLGTSTLDNLGRVINTQTGGLLAVRNTYDAKGKLANIAQGTGSDERDLSFEYNPEGLLKTATDPLGRTLNYEYNAAGRVTREILPDSREVRYGYDASGNLVALTPPGRPAHVFNYSKTGQTAEYNPPDVGAGSNKTLYSYNLDKDLTQITRPDGQILSFSYDSAGRLSQQTLPNGNLNYSYNASTGKLSAISDPDAGSLVFTYNGALLTNTAWTGAITGSVGFGFDTDFRVTALTVNGANPISFSYDADSLLTNAGALSLSRGAQNGLLTGTVLGKLNDSYSYDGFGEVTHYEAKIDTDAVFKTDFTYDKLGRITRKLETLGASSNTYDYAYDTAGRLSEVKRNNSVTASYSYDTNGNRLSRTSGGNTITGSYDDQDRLLSYGNTSYTYTANGELLSKSAGSQTTGYNYDVLGNLRKVTLPNGNSLDYVIDASNRRVGKKVNGVLVQGFVYQDQLKPIAELDGNNAIVSRFVYATHANVPDYLIKGGATYRIITDHLGSPRYVINTADGTIIQQMDYDEFGNVTLDSNPGFQPFGFAGGLYDRDTGLVRFGARDYDAYTGRWTAKDPILFGGGVNLYGYVLGNPITLIDTVGLEPIRFDPFKSIRDIYSGIQQVARDMGGKFQSIFDKGKGISEPSSGKIGKNLNIKGGVIPIGPGDYNDSKILIKEYMKSYRCNHDILKALGDAWNGLGKAAQNEAIENGGIYWNGGFLPISNEGEFNL